MPYDNKAPFIRHVLLLRGIEMTRQSKVKVLWLVFVGRNRGLSWTRWVLGHCTWSCECCHGVNATRVACAGGGAAGDRRDPDPRDRAQETHAPPRLLRGQYIYTMSLSYPGAVYLIDE